MNYRSSLFIILGGKKKFLNLLLQIDMYKKCDAVEEMQQCIETLREEKQHLTSLRDNLEETVASLHLQAASTEREAEEERVSFRSRISDLENHLKEAEEQLEKEKEKVSVVVCVCLQTASEMSASLIFGFC